MHDPIRLTQLAKRAGCAAKQPPDYLLSILKQLPPITNPAVLVGSATADDAAIYKLTDDLALVLTTDFFTPIVDNPFDFGAVAAANALSDVYAMGGKPLTALSIAGFPDAILAPEVLGEILRGAIEIAKEAGIEIVGGHTIKSEEPIFGLAVTGTVAPNRILTNANAQPGDALILTKPLGLGIITTAAKNSVDHLGAITQAIRLMRTLNAGASEVFIEHGAHALTDVTGFGLLGHLRNIVDASDVDATVNFSSVPIIPAARQYAEEGVAPGGTHANHRFMAGWATYAEDLTVPEQLLLCDAQTSGGLLAAVSAASADEIVAALRARSLADAAVVGFISKRKPGEQNSRISAVR